MTQAAITRISHALQTSSFAAQNKTSVPPLRLPVSLLVSALGLLHLFLQSLCESYYQIASFMHSWMCRKAPQPCLLLTSIPAAATLRQGKGMNCQQVHVWYCFQLYAAVRTGCCKCSSKMLIKCFIYLSMHGGTNCLLWGPEIQELSFNKVQESCLYNLKRQVQKKILLYG